MTELTIIMDAESDAKQLGAALRSIRTIAQMKQGDVAGIVGITTSHLSLLENGHRKTTVERYSDLIAACGGRVELIITHPYQKRTSEIDE